MALTLGSVPIVAAPMAGGPTTPALVAAVSGIGGFAFAAAGYLDPADLADGLRAVRLGTEAPFGVNVFVPSTPGYSDAVARYAASLAPEAARLGVALGEPRWEDDWYAAKLELLVTAPGVSAVSFTFGCPSAFDVERLHAAGRSVLVTVTSVPEAVAAVGVGADALLVQGTEAGGHQGAFLDLSARTSPLLSVLADVRSVTALPLVAAGGVSTAEDVAACLAGGAVAVAIGTALLCTPEAGTSGVYRKALLDRQFGETMLTRAFSGRWARGLANRFAVEHTGDAPEAYPEVHHLTRPLRAAATAAGDASVPNLWAGTGWASVRAEPAADVVRRLLPV